MQSRHKHTVVDFVPKAKLLVIGLNMPRILIAYYLASRRALFRSIYKG